MRGKDMVSSKKKSHPLSFTTAKKISEMIIRENMKPGTKLPNESKLAEMSGVSRSTVREALKALKAQNIVIIRQGDGTYVSSNTGRPEDPLGFRYLQKESLIDDIFEARLLIEPQIAMLAVERATEDEIADLKRVVDEMLVTDYLNSKRMSLDIEFHTILTRCAKNAVFDQLMPVIYETIEKGVVLLYESEESHKRAQIAHLDIYNAFAKREAWRVKNALTTHIYSSLEDIHRLGARGK